MVLPMRFLFPYFFIFSSLSFSSFAYASCPIGIENNSVSWVYSEFGSHPYVCANGCKSALYSISNLYSTCFVNGDFCIGSFKTDGNDCPDDDGFYSGGDFPPDDTEPDYIPAYTGTNPDSAATYTAQNLSFMNKLKALVDENTQQNSYTQMLIGGMSQSVSESAIKISNVSSDLDSSLDQMDGKFTNVQNKVEEVGHRQTINKLSLDSQLNAIKNKISGGSDGGYDDALTKIDNSINNSVYHTASTVFTGLIDQTNSLKSSQQSNTLSLKNSIDGLGSGIDAIGDSLSTGDYSPRDSIGQVDFNSLSLFEPSAIQQLQADAVQLRQDYDTQVNEFRSLLSFDSSSLNQGQYSDHSINLTLANGQTVIGISSVFPALIDAAPLIAAVIIFLAAILGSRFLF